ncbi:MAG: thiamine diphosphokinase [candidate division KSB1 bacterium]|nr:thiamine diphosphokinase [candidate division KSB1 bacterium]MDZ7272815.1 thiamine diphosphokinase [candidate division KSB1 bacterium]MDZ7284161.1 thiamine diphosphokinase [candidate division KSB1 bacterium]MDZ7297441.1 thiamine diphosphokinase [candidate division KSB1 bacterium]MDZ7348308.1 thiamine diphosphokinase [candidate division KSB1 bacterium]
MLQPTALIILNSVLPKRAILLECRQRAQAVICADGGANRALQRGLLPDYVVGDLDSVTPATRAVCAAATFIHYPSQDATDLEKALTFALERDFRGALLVGITGLRYDHQLVNLNIAEKFCSRLTLETHDDFGIGSFITPGPAAAVFPSFPGQQISLIAFRRAAGITTTGLKYPLNHEALEWAVRDGLSNEALAGTFSVAVEQGNLFCYRVRRS